MMRPVHRFQNQRVHRVMLWEEHRMIGQTTAQAVLIQDLNLVLILIPEPLLLVIDTKIERFAVELVLVMRLGRSSRGTHMRLLLLLIRRARQAAAVTMAEIIWQLLNIRHADAQRINAGLLWAYVARHLSWTRIFLPHGWRILRVVQQRRGQGDATEVSAHHTAAITRPCSCTPLGII